MKTEDQQLIENYLRGLLSEFEERTFLDRLETDTDFREKFNFEKQLFDTLSEDGWSFIENTKSDEVKEYTALLKKEAKELEQKISEVAASYKDQTSKRRIGWGWYVAAAVLLLCLTLIPVINSSKPDPEQLYVEYLDVSELSTIAVRGDATDSLLLSAQHLFKQKDYTAALSIFENELNTANKNLGAIYLYKGICFMELDQFEKAETTLDQLIATNLMDAQKGYWYKALLYLKMGNTKKAETILKEIVSKRYYRKDKAERLLDELK